MKTINYEIINILAYSDVFNYPLTKQEIFERSSFSIFEIEIGLELLVTSSEIFCINHFYTLRNDPSVIQQRLECNKKAQESLKTARLITKILSFIPFIRGVFLSGSIAKDCMNPKSDIDFFIITAPKFLWIARSFCVLLKKTVLFNSEKYFCFNYIIDEDHLKIVDESLFTANEVVTLIPVFGEDVCKRFIDENTWVKHYFPNFRIGKQKVKMVPKQLFQQYFETLFDNKLGERLDEWLFEKTLAVNKKRHPEKYFQNPDIYLNLQRSVAKTHTSNLHEKILEKYRKNLSHYKAKNVVF
ncbi:MAG: nucleotidyltransferase domain-containing protein [Spirosomataceae bacterium]